MNPRLVRRPQTTTTYFPFCARRATKLRPLQGRAERRVGARRSFPLKPPMATERERKMSGQDNRGACTDL